jgi:hypothetical protein
MHNPVFESLVFDDRTDAGARERYPPTPVKLERKAPTAESPARAAKETMGNFILFQQQQDYLTD